MLSPKTHKTLCNSPFFSPGPELNRGLWKKTDAGQARYHVQIRCSTKRNLNCAIVCSQLRIAAIWVLMLTQAAFEEQKCHHRKERISIRRPLATSVNSALLSQPYEERLGQALVHDHPSVSNAPGELAVLCGAHRLSPTYAAARPKSLCWGHLCCHGKMILLIKGLPKLDARLRAVDSAFLQRSPWNG